MKYATEVCPYFICKWHTSSPLDPYASRGFFGGVFPCADATWWMRTVQVLEMRLLPRCRAMSLQWSTLRTSLEEGLSREGAGSAAAAAAVACASYAFRFVCANDEVLVARLRGLQDPGLLVRLHGCRWAYLSARQSVRVQLGTGRAHLARAQVCPTASTLGNFHAF